MGKKERLDREIWFLQERYKNIFMLFFGVLTGDTTLIYYVVSGDKPIEVLLLATIGAIIAIVLYITIKSIKTQIETKLDELEDL